MIQKNGFTLIEMLVVLTIGSLFLVGLSSTIGSFGDHLKRAEKADQALSSGPNIQDLHLMLEGASFEDANGNVFPQSRSRLRFRLPAAQALGGAGWREMKLEARPARLGVDLILSPQEDEAAMPTKVILRAARSVQFEVAKPAGQSNLKQPIKNINIEIEMADAEPFQLKIMPKITSSASCTYYPISQGCVP